MLFSLEVLRAKHGDSLLLRFGDADDPKLIVIDGGPSGVFKDALKPRLEQLCKEAGGKLPIEILMVSHLDSDHVRGIVELSNALARKPPTLEGEYKVKTLWQNTFADVIAGGGDGDPAEAGAGVPAGLKKATVASVNEGRQVRDNARLLHWPENKGFDESVMAPNDEGVGIDFDPLRLTVVGPRQQELDELRKEWAKKTKELKKAKPAEAAEIAEYLDESVYNLSSIVCVAEIKGKRMLLTGDARGDKVLLGLEAAGFLPAGDGKMELDLLKVPHHGSSRNLDVDFFERLPAPHLVISANGKDGNPDLATLEMISKARPDDKFTLHLTESKFKEDIGPEIEAFFEKERKAGRKYKVEFRPEDELLLRIDLLDPPA